jgi:hypothetical protein
MKIGWLVWSYEDELHPVLYTTEPNRYYYKVVRIVYAEVPE